MKAKKPSTSAEEVTALRAAESMKAEGERVCYDPVAKDFVGAKFKIVVKNPILRAIVLRQVERKLPGVFGCIVSRTRYIDEYLKACLDEGVEQIVILGAGYDSRAYRFNDLLRTIKVFEVDHPLTQKIKIEKVRKIWGRLPDRVIYVSIDFDRERLDKRLFESGYDGGIKTLFIWEGVTMYITAEAVDDTLAFIAKNSGRGSSLLFHYLFRSVLDGTCKLEYAGKIRKLHERLGAVRFGIEEGAVEPFLSKRGFHQVNNVTGEFFKETYLRGIDQNRKACSLCGFATATIKDNAF